jgi:hypothetical protein
MVTLKAHALYVKYYSQQGAIRRRRGMFLVFIHGYFVNATHVAVTLLSIKLHGT